MEELPAIQWRWTTPVILAGVMASQIAEAVAEAITDMTSAVASHSNWRRQQATFADEARQEIERITSG